MKNIIRITYPRKELFFDKCVNDGLVPTTVIQCAIDSYLGGKLDLDFVREYHREVARLSWEHRSEAMRQNQKKRWSKPLTNK
jgi:hypothetical protein